jgi:hypothetical protein
MNDDHGDACRKFGRRFKMKEARKNNEWLQPDPLTPTYATTNTFNSGAQYSNINVSNVATGKSSSFVPAPAAHRRQCYLNSIIIDLMSISFLHSILFVKVKQ